SRLAVGGEAHDLVLARIHSKAGEIREGRIEKTERVWKAHLAQQLELIAAPDTDRRRGPLADAVHRDNGGLFERRREKRGCGVRFVVLAEQDFAVVTVEMVADVVAHPQFLAQP